MLKYLCIRNVDSLLGSDIIIGEYIMGLLELS